MKFRIWDKRKGKMIYPESPEAGHFTINLKGGVYYLDGNDFGYLVMPLVEASTKFGDIYVGDIIKVENLGEWWDHEGDISEDDKYHYCFIRDVRRYNYSQEIFNAVEKSGNIFENPEIIETIKEKYKRITGGKEMPDSSFELSQLV